MAGTFVHVERPSSRFKDRFRGYWIVLDGVYRKKLRNGRDVLLSVEPGIHHLAVKIDWTGSGVEEFTVQEGETVRFVCEATPVVELGRAFSSEGYVSLRRVGRIET